MNIPGCRHALAFGGNEKNMEPGWKFMRELAKTGNIGRVAKTEVDFINSLSSGECSVGIWSNAAWGKIAEVGPCVFLNRVPGDKVFRTGLLTEGFMIPVNSTKKKQAKEFLNFFVSPESNEIYNKPLNFVPTNSKSAATPMAQNIVFKTSEERKEFAVVFDFEALSERQNEMNLHVGFAARDGVEAAALAEAGVTASPNAVIGPLGFFDVCAPDHGDIDWITERLGNPFDVIEPGLSPKLYPSCSETHSAVDAILAMRAEGLKASDVRRIRAGITPATRDNLVYSNPSTPLEAKFSQEYCIAAPLVRGKLGLAEFDLPSCGIRPSEI